MTSPIPQESKEVCTVMSKGLSFPDAMREVLNGRRITRLEWGTNDNYCLLKDTFLQIFIRGEFHAWTVNDGDMTAIDWVVLPEQN